MAEATLLEEIVDHVTKLYGIHEQNLVNMNLLKDKNDRLSDRVDALSRRVRDLEGHKRQKSNSELSINAPLSEYNPDP